MPTNVATLPPREPGAPAYRTPPHNYEAEQGLLGAILVNNSAYERVSEFLAPEHFADPVNGRIFAAAGKLIERGQLANPVTLKSYFDQDGALTEMGGAAYLARLAANVVTVINAQDYGRTIRDLSMRRQLIDLGEDMVNQAFAADIDSDARDQIEQAESKLFSLAESGQAESGFRPFSHALTESIRLAELAHKREGKIAGVPTGLVDLDRLLGGLHNSDLLILAGRPSMGKTALATNIAFYAATRSLDDSTQPRQPVGFFSLEMSSEQLATRILAEQANLSSQKIRQGELSHGDFDQLVMASQRLERTPLYIDDTPAITVSNLRTRARRLKRQQGLAVIVVDYLQLMRPGGTSRSENRVQEVSEITRGLKAIAKELNVPVLALSQLSRAPEMREDKRPQLSDLRESGSIEQDADVVMFVFREQYYLERAEPARRPEEAEDKFNDRHDRWKERCEQVYGTAEVIVAKQRHGPTGTVRLHFDGQTTKFDNFVDRGHLPDAMP